MMVTLPGSLEAGYLANAASFGGLGKGGLITLIVIAVILIPTVIWLINGTKERD
jgi:hypothetical protein